MHVSKHEIDAWPANTCRQNGPNGRPTRDEAEGERCLDHVIERYVSANRLYGQRLIGVPPSTSPWPCSRFGQSVQHIRPSQLRPHRRLTSRPVLLLSPKSRSPGAQQPLQMHFLVVKPLPAAAVTVAAASYRSLSDTHSPHIRDPRPRLTYNNNHN